MVEAGAGTFVTDEKVSDFPEFAAHLSVAAEEGKMHSMKQLIRKKRATRNPELIEILFNVLADCMLRNCRMSTTVFAYAVPPKRVHTSLETPGSCMVTPYNAGAILMVFLLWVISTNWVFMLISRTSSVKRPMLASSSGASTSSRMQNGLG